jgi:3-hydroxymyristoyl/3-hydroxydecanoyl-(acyl carrier protein) dehydratase
MHADASIPARVAPRGIPFERVRTLLPYAPPMVMVDRICDWSEDGWIVAEKVISGADPFVVGHFPDGPAIAPGIMLIEMVGQAGVVLGRLMADGHGARDPRHGVTSRVNARYHRPVLVGETVRAEVTRELLPLDKCALRGHLTVSGHAVAEVTVFAGLI